MNKNYEIFDSLLFHRRCGALHFDVVDLCAPCFLLTFFVILEAVQNVLSAPRNLRDYVYARHFVRNVTYDYVVLVRKTVCNLQHFKLITKRARELMPEHAPLLLRHLMLFQRTQTFTDSDFEEQRQRRRKELWRLRIWNHSHLEVLTLTMHFSLCSEAVVSSYTCAMVMELCEKLRRHREERKPHTIYKFVSRLVETVLAIRPLIFMSEMCVAWDAVKQMLELARPSPLCPFCGRRPSPSCSDEKNKYDALMERWNQRLIHVAP